VLQANRNHFNCQSAGGARLENQASSNSSGCSPSSHWDERFFFNSVLGDVIHFHNYLSPITLAAMEDMGWYMPDYSVAQVPPFGLGAGCQFLDEPCISNDGEVPYYSKGFFCDDLWADSPIRGCDATHTVIASCDLRDDVNPPEEFQWFPNKSWGSAFEETDYCPIRRYWKDYCDSDQRCFEVVNDDAQCLEYECKDGTIEFSVDNGDSYKCSNDFEVVTTKSGEEIICPRYTAVCSEYVCPSNCSGRGVCNFDTNKCECFDKDDDSEGCYGFLPSSSQGPPSSGENSGGSSSGGNNQENNGSSEQAPGSSDGKKKNKGTGGGGKKPKAEKVNAVQEPPSNNDMNSNDHRHHSLHETRRLRRKIHYD